MSERHLDRRALASASTPDLVFHPVSKAVGSPKNDGPDLVEPIAL